MKNSDWIYLAGLFDGEGCVTVSIVERKTDSRSGKAGTRMLNMSLRIANNDPRVLLWLENNFGGKVRQHGGGGPQRNSWVWIVQGELSVVAAQNLLKHSRMKADQLEIFIALHMLKKKPGQRVTNKDWDARLKLMNSLRSTTHRRKVGLRLISE